MQPAAAIRRRRSRAPGVLALLLGVPCCASLAACGDRGREERSPGGGGEGESSSRAAAAVAGEPAAAGVEHGGEGALEGATAALAPLLARADSPGTLSDADRQALEQAMQGILEPAASACDGCSAAVSYVDEAGGGDHFRCVVRDPNGDRVADLEVFHRPDLPAAAAKSWARETFHGHPASALAGEHIFVWPGRFEIRAFGRAASLRDEQRLEDLLASLPLDALAKL